MSSGDADFPQSDELAGRADKPRADSSTEEPASAPREGAFAALATMPPLSLLAALAALTWVLIHRLILPLLGIYHIAPPGLLLLIAPFALNLAACAGVLAAGWASLDLLRTVRLSFFGRRMIIVTLAALVLTTLFAAIFLPDGYVNPSHVLVAAGALHMMVVQLAMTTLRAEHSLAGRTTSSLLASASLFAVTSMLLRHLPVSQWAWASAGIASLHGLGELSFLLTPIAAAFVMLPWGDDSAARLARRTAMAFVCIMALVFSAAARIPDALYGHLLYSTLRLEWALERASLGYAIPISLAIGAAAGASVGRDPRNRQGGAGLWLWMLGGYNPLTPARVLLTALGAMLMCRAILTLGDTEPSSENQAP